MDLKIKDTLIASYLMMRGHKPKRTEKEGRVFIWIFDRETASIDMIDFTTVSNEESKIISDFMQIYSKNLKTVKNG